MSELNDWLHRLPHGQAARVVSEIVEHRQGQIVTLMSWDSSNSLIAAHFPAGPHVVPGVMLAEQVAQSALLLGMLDGLMLIDDLYMLGRLRSDFLRPALAPCAVRAVTVLTGRAGGQIGFQGECFVDDVLVARIKGLAAPAPRAS